jgi:hypothetical protein
MAMPEQRVVLALRITDYERSKVFYVEKLGFGLEWEHRFEPHLPVFMSVVRDGMKLFLSEHAGDCQVGGLVHLLVPDTDFWAAYDAVGRIKQKCWPHQLRDLKEVDQGAESGGDWPAFAKRLRRVYTDAVRLELARGVMPPGEYSMKLARLGGRVIDLGIEEWTNPHAQRLSKRLRKYGDELLTFVEFEVVPSSNSHAEREV